MFSNIFFLENPAVYEITRKNIVESGRPQMTIPCMHIESWIPTATNTHLDYVILIPFPLQQWLHERASVLRLYVHCLSFNRFHHHLLLSLTSVPLRNYYEIFLKHPSLSNALFILANCRECLKLTAPKLIGIPFTQNHFSGMILHSFGKIFFFSERRQNKLA